MLHVLCTADTAMRDPLFTATAAFSTIAVVVSNGPCLHVEGIHTRRIVTVMADYMTIRNWSNKPFIYETRCTARAPSSSEVRITIFIPSGIKRPTAIVEI